MGKDAVFYPILVKLDLAKKDKDGLIIFNKNIFGTNSLKYEAYGVYLVNWIIENDHLLNIYL